MATNRKNIFNKLRNAKETIESIENTHTYTYPHVFVLAKL